MPVKTVGVEEFHRLDSQVGARPGAEGKAEAHLGAVDRRVRHVAV